MFLNKAVGKSQVSITIAREDELKAIQDVYYESIKSVTFGATRVFFKRLLTSVHIFITLGLWIFLIFLLSSSLSLFYWLVLVILALFYVWACYLAFHFYAEYAREVIANKDLSKANFNSFYKFDGSLNTFLVARIGDKIIGCAGLCDSKTTRQQIAEEWPTVQIADSDCFMARVAVDPKVQGAGIGARLVEEIQWVAIKNGCKRCLLTISEGQPAAYRMYTTRGWSVLTHYQYPLRLGLSLRIFFLEKNL